MEKILIINSIHKKAGITVTIFGKHDFKSANVSREKEGHFIVIKWWIIRKISQFKNLCAANNRPPTSTQPKLTELKYKIDNKTIIVEYFKTPFLIAGRKIRQEISKNKKT